MDHYNHLNKPKSKTILLPTDSFLPMIGGMEIGLHNIALRLNNKGYVPILIIPFQNYFKIKLKRISLPYKIVPSFPKLSLMLLRYEKLTLFLFGLILKAINYYYKINIFHVTSCYPIGIVVIKYAKTNNIPVIVRAVGADIQIDKSIDYGVRIDPRVDKLIKEWLPQADYLIATTNSIVKEYEKLGVNQKKIKKIPNGVCVDYFNSISKDNSPKLNFLPKSDNLTFLSVGRYHKKKGFEILLHAIKVLKLNNLNNFRVVLIGHGLKDDLEILADELDILDKIIFVDAILNIKNKKISFSLPDPNLVRAYKASDVFVLPSLVESFGIVLVEAMAAELPIITTDGPGCRDVIFNGKYGYMVEVGNKKDLAKAMTKFITDEKLRLDYKTKSIEGLKHYDWDNIITRYDKLYQSLLV